MQDSPSNDSHLITFLLLIFAGFTVAFQSFAHASATQDMRAELSECKATVTAMERTLLMRGK